MFQTCDSLFVDKVAGTPVSDPSFPKESFFGFGGHTAWLTNAFQVDFGSNGSSTSATLATALSYGIFSDGGNLLYGGTLVGDWKPDNFQDSAAVGYGRTVGSVRYELSHADYGIFLVKSQIPEPSIIALSELA